MLHEECISTKENDQNMRDYANHVLVPHGLITLTLYYESMK